MQKIFFIFAKNKLKKMRIIHFSDFHLDKSNLTQSNNIVYHLENTLKLINQEKNIDLILFTGDMINQGGQNFPTVEEAFKTFKIVRKVIKN